jgi:hypothetical protein
MEKLDIKNIGSCKDKVLLVCDNGLFFEFALKLADHFKKVYYYTEWKNAYPAMAEAMIGTEWKNGKRLDSFDGKNIERIENMFSVLDEIDCFFTPDIYDGDLLETLEVSGIPSFGSGKAERLELDRYETAKEMKSIGMDVAPTLRIVGMKALREHLKKVEDKWIKISKYRKTFETFHHINYKLSEPLLDNVESTLGPLKYIVEFVVVDSIEAVVEEGIDAYAVDGQLPSKMFTGCEIKDVAYAGAVVDQANLSIGNKRVNSQFLKLLKKYDHNGFFSTEVRTTKDGKNYFIDPCMRLGLPPNALYQEIYKNLGEIIWCGANNMLIEPKFDNMYGMEILISSGWHSGNHQTVYFPPEIRQWVKLINPIKIDGTYHVLRIGDSSTIGSLVAVGKSHEECAKKIEKMAKLIEGYDLHIKTEGIDEAVDAFKQMEKLSKK